MPVRATGDRDATVVVQAYLAGPEGFDRVPKSLAGFAKAIVPAGEEGTVTVTIPAEPFRRWGSDGWVVDAGRWKVQLAASATDVRQELELQVR